MNTHKLVVAALILTGVGLTAQAALSAESEPMPAADAGMAAQHHDASMNMDSAKGEDAIADAVANDTAGQSVHAMPMDMPMDDMAMPEGHDAAAAHDAKPAQNMDDKDTTDKLHSMSGEQDMHAHHHNMAPGTTRTTVDYTVPPVTLVRADGKSVSLVDELNDGRPVVLTFIYTSCTTICPMVSQTFEQLQDELGSERDKVHFVSISIDPEQDTPARLRAYAERFGAGPQWQYYTGTVDASIAAQRAFNVYRGDKMNHTAVAFLRAAPGKPWLRLDGPATPGELLSAYHEVVASNGS